MDTRLIDYLMFSTLFIIYNFLLVIATLISFVISPFFLFNKRTKDYFYRFRLNCGGRYKFLIHGASVGEHNGTLPLKTIFESMIYTVNTTTGFEKLKKNNVSANYLPWDLPILIIPYINKVDKIIIVESEINPNMIFFAKILNKKMILINGRISDGNLHFYKLFGAFYKTMFHFFEKIYVSNDIEEKKFSKLGIITEILGNTKYTNIKYFGKQSNKVILFASTHIIDEELIFRSLKNIKDKIIVIAPRHINRVPSILKIYQNFNLKIFTNIQSLKKGEIYIIDKMGILNEIYANSLFTYVGGTFNRTIGGHNPLEPISYGSYVISGPFYNNFKPEMGEILKNGCGSIIHSSEELEKHIENFSCPSTSKNFAEIIKDIKPNLNICKILNNQ
jgi:3-deoxy-D-manno-octulosonic-acid transferase